ncbi:hypothetical protein TSUD_106440 [Trifolium subterraneum]|uniref:Reverse transcriptase domain-containing protein n=1 Tax=Trifolium subterraneum TaxID=3900 RepID=A0A2Z6P0C0_TRISU|nr:hypothetical protein TSUD_106440 [Trifolium subterraneum]
MGDDVHQWQTVQGRRKKGSQKKSDIATAISSHNEHPDDITTYFLRASRTVSIIWAVKTGKLLRQPGAQSIVLSYEAAKEDIEKLHKAFVGVVHEPGMTYNIQSAFHRQGYFGVKVTPLGANLALLEGQEDGEVKALMEDAKGWMDQWFKEIRSWCPSDLDAERTIWLRIYGVPSHAWNESFFTQLVKPWSSFINEDEGTLKKSTMDVARLMIRTSCQQIIDEFVDVKVNDVVYHLRVLEDSYGPMRIMIPKKNGNEGRDSSVESEEDEEEKVQGMWTEGVMEEREIEVGESIALKQTSNANIAQVNSTGPNLGSNNDKEEGEEISKSVEGVRSKEVSRLVDGGILLGQEDGAGGPQNSTTNHHNIKVGVLRRLTQSDNMGCVTKPIRPKDTVSGGEVEQVGGVYSDGPNNVYLKLNKSPAHIDTTMLSKGMQVKNNKSVKRVNPIPAVLAITISTGKNPDNSCSSRFRQCYAAVHSIPQILEIVTRDLWKFMSLIRRARFGKKLLSWGLKEMKKKSGEWCLGGDFNSISKVGERKGSSSGAWRQGEMVEFTQFIDALEVGDRDISDDCPIWLMCSNINWGPKPFTFNNCWLEHPKFFEFVKETWENMDIRGKKAFIIKEKLKGLTEALKAWLKWIRACIFESSMSVLVNGSPTADFKVGRGLRQGDPLSPFLFLIVAEGLTGLMRKAVELGKFKEYRINNNIQFQILQFAVDTILMGEGIWDNIWIIKTLLRSFELVSGLKINFVKSKLYGLNVDSRLLEVGSAFLSCRSETIPFKFLGIPVGANPRRQETWKSMVDAMIKRLNSWISRQLSYGGNFLWGGGLDDKKLCWVKWDQICLPKESGGLGVKNLELFNLALLSKWKWRLLSDGDAIWADLLRFRYGHLPTQILGRDTHLTGAKHSIWWKDVVSLGRDFEVDWFKQHIGCRVGNGRDIGFWKFKWFGGHAFKDLFPTLFAKVTNHEVFIVGRMQGNGSNFVWSW